jgi:hypothetical protein
MASNQVTIAVGNEISSWLTPLAGGGIDLAGIVVPSNYSGTTLEVNISPDGGTTVIPVVVPATGIAYTMTVGNSGPYYFPIPRDQMRGIGAFSVQLVSNESQLSTPATFTLVFE